MVFAALIAGWAGWFILSTFGLAITDLAICEDEEELVTAIRTVEAQAALCAAQVKAHEREEIEAAKARARCSLQKIEADAKRSIATLEAAARQRRAARRQRLDHYWRRRKEEQQQKRKKEEEQRHQLQQKIFFKKHRENMSCVLFELQGRKPTILRMLVRCAAKVTIRLGLASTVAPTAA